MDEEFLQFAWKFRLFENNLRSTMGESVEVIRPGEHNRDSGPDFFNAMVRLGGTKWVGNIECHVKSSDWYLHGHHLDKAYDNVILHVVFEHDDVVLISDGSSLPTLEASKYLKLKALDIYRHWLRNRSSIPCSQMISSLDRVHFKDWLTYLSISRIERKTSELKEIWENSHTDFNSLFFIFLFRSFGQKINTLSFELLMKSIPLHLLQKFRDDRLLLEALLFGQAGMLNEAYDEGYPRMLEKLYRNQKSQYDLQPMEPHLWKFLRLRPPSFPTIRISQLAGLINKHRFLPDLLLGDKSHKELVEALSSEASEYWKTHYLFGRSTNKHSVSLGGDAKRLIILNLVNPFKLLRPGAGKSKVISQVTKILEEMEPENNSIIRQFKELGFRAENAAESQAMIELRTQYCNFRRCLSCRIGYRLLKQYS
jgi:hypothetical protein